MSCAKTVESSPHLKCLRCNRTYKLESALKRHGYYCRSKSPGRRTHRKRACISCFHAKTKCSSTVPSCSTCIAKGLNCRYDPDTLRELENEARVPSRAGDWTGPLGRNLQDQSLDQFVVDEDFERFLEPFGSTLESTAIGLESSGRQGHFPIPLLSTLPTTTSTFSALVADGTDEIPPLQLQQDTLNCDIPPLLVNTALITRRQSHIANEVSAKLLRNIMMSFPLMMRRRETLPPFIHPSMLASGEDKRSSSFYDDLVQCMSLAQTWSFKHPKTAGFVWNTARTQIEKWWSCNHTYSNNQLLACQQVLLVYTLMRMSEGTLTPNPIDEPLLLTLGIVSKTLADRVGNAEFIYGTLHRVQSWDEWVFHESRRRIATLARLINLLVDIDSAVTCYLLPGYVLVPLPSGQSMWDASDETIWRKEFDLSMNEEKVYGLGADGKLKILPRYGKGGLTAREVEWEEFLARENGFGMMVMIAGSIIETNISLERIPRTGAYQ